MDWYTYFYWEDYQNEKWEELEGFWGEEAQDKRLNKIQQEIDETTNFFEIDEEIFF